MSFGIKELVVILLIVAVIFGTKKLRNMGGDLGGAVKSFRKAMDEGENDGPAQLGSADEELKPPRHTEPAHKSDRSG